jgi:hypothetical protein
MDISTSSTPINDNSQILNPKKIITCPTRHICSLALLECNTGSTHVTPVLAMTPVTGVQKVCESGHMYM